MATQTKSRYQIKKEQGLVPSIYDRDSKRYQAGAWPNLSKEAYRTNRRALENRG